MQSSSRGMRLMQKMGGKKEDMGSAGLGGDAGLSQLGSPPNGVLGTQQDRSSYQSPRELCPRCDSPLPQKPVKRCQGCGEIFHGNESFNESQPSFDERIHQYRSRVQEEERPRRQAEQTSIDRITEHLMQSLRLENYYGLLESRIPGGEYEREALLRTGIFTLLDNFQTKKLLEEVYWVMEHGNGNRKGVIR